MNDFGITMLLEVMHWPKVVKESLKKILIISFQRLEWPNGDLYSSQAVAFAAKAATHHGPRYSQEHLNWSKIVLKQPKAYSSHQWHRLKTSIRRHLWLEELMVE